MALDATAAALAGTQIATALGQPFPPVIAAWTAIVQVLFDNIRAHAVVDPTGNRDAPGTPEAVPMANAAGPVAGKGSIA